MGIMRRLTVRAAGVTLVVAVLAGCASAAEPADGAGPGDPAVPPRAFAAVVERVVDGDTLIARRSGARLRVRLIGVDAPESVRPDSPVECWGREAAAVLARLLPPGTRVRAAYQPGGRRDRYDRELWDVWLPDGRLVQAVLVRRGAARATAYEPQVVHEDLLSTLEGRARASRRGLFGACPE